MKKNWNNFRQTLERVVYDGTARPGRGSDESVYLFVEKLFRRTKENHAEIIEEISNRNIQWLVHFTFAFNVSAILKYGLIPRDFLEKKPLRNMIQSVFPDDNRYDNLMSSNCISISFPNYKLFYSKRKELGKNWSVVLIDPKILSYCPCLFFRENVAKGISGRSTKQGFQEMFYDKRINNTPENLREYLRLPECFATNPQAEILVNSAIPHKFIKAAYVEKWSVKKLIEARCGKKFKEKIWVSDKYFQGRHDHHYWQKDPKTTKKEKEPNGDFRKKYEAPFRATDGHYVRSKAELIIDNWLYQNKILHEYEKLLPIEEKVFSDFYLSESDIYIEYWGYANNKKYFDRKEKKIKIYKKYKYKLIELTDIDINTLDDRLPLKLQEMKNPSQKIL